MNNNKRIHGRLLIATGLIHTIAAFLPGIFGEQFIRFSKKGFFFISKGIAAFPLFGGVFNYENFAAFWFFYTGLFFILCGQLIEAIEQSKGMVPRQSAIFFLILTSIGAYMIPFSGMTILMLPQAVYMLARSK